MLVCIVTVYDSVNCGSYWQAFALGNVLQSQGCDVVYLKRDKRGGASSSPSSQMIRLVKYTVKHGLKCGLRFYKGLRRFKTMQKSFKTVSSIKDIDCFVLGSDTIWNLDSAYFNLHYKTYWGLDFLPKKVFSYAASAANTHSSKIRDNMKEAISKFSSVSVRDEHTYQLIKNSTEKDVKIVGDPTLLLDKEAYQRHLEKRRAHRYIYLYLFSEPSSELVRQLKKIASEKGLIIVNGAGPVLPDYCDEGSAPSPTRFITDVLYADYVITDTFHGTVFSVLFNKQFVSLDRKKNKVNELLKSINLIDRLVKDENTINILTQNIEYLSVNNSIDLLRKESMDFLTNSLFNT